MGTVLGAIAQTLLQQQASQPDAPTGEPYRRVIRVCRHCSESAGTTYDVSDTIADEAKCDAEIIDMTEGPTQGHRTRAIPPARRIQVMDRHDWKCAVPHCQSKLWLHIHHVDEWGQGGSHDKGNIVPVCSLCRARHKLHYADRRIMPRRTPGRGGRARSPHPCAA